ncbi:MAG: hypothetical protein IPK76_22650 [Lewinellaceae bacterium]|nr:hypothetical protein [Lewinellaceae bacterium]
MDEVRIWKHARTQTDIQADMNRRLSGRENGLVGYWQFGNGLATDFSAYGNDGVVSGNPRQVASPLLAYSFFAGVNGKFVEAKEVVPAGNWAHLAAVFAQSYGLKFDGESAYLDCDNDESLNIDKDLTIEVLLKAEDLNRSSTLVSRGMAGGSGSQKVPYILTIKPGGKIEFSFGDVNGKMHKYRSDETINTNTKWVAVTRKWKTFTYRETPGSPTNHTFGWYEIGVHIEGKASKTFIYSYNELVEAAIKSAISSTPNTILINQIVSAYLPSQLSPVGIGRSDLATLIGKTDSDDGTVSKFKGIITEVRIWNAARDSRGVDINDPEDGLVTWLRFQERSGIQARDWAGQNHARINGNAEWVKDPDMSRSRLVLLRDDSDALTTVPLDATVLSATSNQFQLGAFQLGANMQEHFQGELEEVRIWKTARTREQIQDNLFRRIGGELDDLIAYYTFDAETGPRLSDKALRANHLSIQGAAYFIYSTAPIGEDAPQVRSALAGVRTSFSGLIGSAPAVHEYADLQYDSSGNMIGVFKRCYAYLNNRQLHILTAFKVGDMSIEWIGQVQFAPQLIGFIEGAPPVPSENLTMPSVEMIGDLDDYNEASVVEFVEAQQTTHSYAATKEAGFDMAVELALGFGFKSNSEAGGIGFISSVEESKVMAGLRAQFEASWNWLEEAGISDTRSTGKTTSLELRGRYTTPEENVNEPFGRRFIPDNVGLALVQSQTADVFALRLKQNNALISFTMQPNPDIPKDWNLISFPVNPRYVKQGTLDGKIGPVPDVDYPNALHYSPDSSYFKPVEAYALKNRINREETELENYYNQYNAQGKGRPASMPSQSAKELAGFDTLSGKLRRNLVNTYVWTADGGLFAETQQAMEVRTESYGGSYDFKGMGGIDLKIGFAIAKVAAKFELNAMFGGHQHLNVSQSKESEYSFELNVNLDKVERDIYLREPDNIKLLQLDRSDPKRPKPIKHPYKVDAYRFMSFYLEPDSDHFDLFFQRIVDPVWLEQSDDPSAAALREARQEGKKPPCWRIMHRVTYVSRVLPPLDNSAPPSLEKRCKRSTSTAITNSSNNWNPSSATNSRVTPNSRKPSAAPSATTCPN